MVLELLLLSENDVRQALTIPAAVASQRAAFTALGNGEAVLPPRMLIEGAENSVAFCYAARVAVDGAGVSKFGSVNPTNATRGLPLISALVTVLDAETGVPAAIMDGTVVTEVRTAAASAVAAERLVPGASQMTVFGAGVQAAAHVRAVAYTHQIKQVALCAPSAHLTQLAEDLSAETGVSVVAVPDPQQAVAESDLIITCTTSTQPVLQAAWLPAEATVISIGSFTPNHFEVPPELVDAADVVVDHRATALDDAGPVIAAVQRGTLAENDIHELGTLMVNDLPPRRHGWLYYNSVGLGVQDGAAAAVVVEQARALGLGRQITL